MPRGPEQGAEGRRDVAAALQRAAGRCQAEAEARGQRIDEAAGAPRSARREGRRGRGRDRFRRERRERSRRVGRDRRRRSAGGADGRSAQNPPAGQAAEDAIVTAAGAHPGGNPVCGPVEPRSRARHGAGARPSPVPAAPVARVAAFVLPMDELRRWPRRQGCNGSTPTPIRCGWCKKRSRTQPSPATCRASPSRSWPWTKVRWCWSRHARIWRRSSCRSATSAVLQEGSSSDSIEQQQHQQQQQQ